MKIGDLVKINARPNDQLFLEEEGVHYKQHKPDLGVGIILEILNRGYARKNASALVFWSKLDKTIFHAEPELEIINENR